MSNEPPRRRSAVRTSLTIAVAGALCAGALYGLFLWQAWRIPYGQDEVGGAKVNKSAFEALNEVRVATGRRWWVTSGYRSREHNKKIGGAQHSQHIYGKAFDLAVPHWARAELYEAAKEAGFVGFGWGNRTVHIDMGPPRWWTYDDDNDAVYGRKRFRYLHKSPENFRRDRGLHAR